MANDVTCCQSAPTGKYSGFLDCGRKMMAEGGASTLFKGLAPAMVRAFPANAASVSMSSAASVQLILTAFLGVELSLKVLNSLW